MEGSGTAATMLTLFEPVPVPLSAPIRTPAASIWPKFRDFVPVDGASQSTESVTRAHCKALVGVKSAEVNELIVNAHTYNWLPEGTMVVSTALEVPATAPLPLNDQPATVEPRVPPMPTSLKYEFNSLYFNRLGDLSAPHAPIMEVSSAWVLENVPTLILPVVFRAQFSKT